MKYVGLVIDRYATEPFIFKHWYNEGQAYGYSQKYVKFIPWAEPWLLEGNRYYNDERPMPLETWNRIKQYPKITVRLKPKDKKK